MDNTSYLFALSLAKQIAENYDKKEDIDRILALVSSLLAVNLLIPPRQS
jgi:hypothetical protein